VQRAPSQRGRVVRTSRRARPAACAWVLTAWLGAVAAGCGGDAEPGVPARQVVRERVAALAPAANLAHRGSGPTRPLSPLPENSLAAFRQAMALGADGVELDVELTRDGALLVMHDDTLDRTSTCRGCVSAYTLAEAQQCVLVDGHGAPTGERPPSLAQVYAALPAAALVNVELKVYGQCATPDTGAAALARAAAAEIRRLGVARRTLVSSFEEEALLALRRADPTLYAALLVGTAGPDDVTRVAALGLDAIHPTWSGVTADTVAFARAVGLQVNLWTVNSRTFLAQALAKGPTAIITDQPDVLRDLITAPDG
jgi:glycerophosphoryl diester phosphodiesterase